LARSWKATRLQAARLQYYQPQKKKLIGDFLREHRRTDLIPKINHLQKSNPRRTR